MQPFQLWKNHRFAATNGRSRRTGIALGAVGVIAAVIAARFTPLRLSRFTVQGPSMEPALQEGDRLLVLHGSVRLLGLRPGDVVVARSPAAPGREVVKRIAVVATGPGRMGYVLHGDNPSASTDSRHFGPLPGSAIRGRVLYRYWPEERRGPIGRARH